MIRLFPLLLLAMLSACVGGQDTTPGGTIIPMPGSPFSAIPSPDGTWLFVSLQNGNHGEIDVLARQGDSFSPHRRWPIGSIPAGLALSRDGKLLAISAGREVDLVDATRLATGTGSPLSHRILHQGDAVYAAFTPDAHLLAVSEEHGREIMLIDPANGAELGAIKVDHTPLGLAFDPTGNWLYATSIASTQTIDATCPSDQGLSGIKPGTISVIALKPTPHLASSITLGCSPVRVALSRDGQLALVSLRGEDRIAAYSTTDWQHGQVRRLSTVSAGIAPVGMALTPDDRHLIVAATSASGDGAPGVISCLAVTPDGHSMTVVAHWNAGQFPREVAALPDMQHAVITISGDNALQVVPTTCNGSPSFGP